MDAGKPSVNEERITYADDGHRELLETVKTPMYDSDGHLLGRTRRCPRHHRPARS